MEILSFKIGLVLLIVLAALVGGLIPIRINISKSNEKWLVLGNAMAGGIFLGAGLLHMLPESVEQFEAIQSGIEFPFAFLLAGFGFLLILLLEKVFLGGEHGADSSLVGQNNFSPFLLTFILSVHSIIAGTTLGLENELLSSLIIFIAIISHKGFAAFALGISLRDCQLSTSKQSGVIGFFSLMTPLGIGLGTGLSSLLESGILTNIEGIFGALAAGTFLYVATQEIIEEVFHEKENALLKIIFMTAGFVVMAVLAIAA